MAKVWVSSQLIEVTMAGFSKAQIPLLHMSSVSYLPAPHVTRTQLGLSHF